MRERFLKVERASESLRGILYRRMIAKRSFAAQKICYLTVILIHQPIKGVQYWFGQIVHIYGHSIVEVGYRHLQWPAMRRISNFPMPFGEVSHRLSPSNDPRPSARLLGYGNPLYGNFERQCHDWNCTTTPHTAPTAVALSRVAVSRSCLRQLSLAARLGRTVPRRNP